MELSSTQLFSNYPAHVFQFQDIPQLTGKELLQGTTIAITKKSEQQPLKGKFFSHGSAALTVFSKEKNKWSYNSIRDYSIHELAIPYPLEPSILKQNIEIILPSFPTDLVHIISQYVTDLPKPQMRAMISLYAQDEFSGGNTRVMSQKRTLDDLASKTCHLNLGGLACRLLLTQQTSNDKTKTTQELTQVIATAIARFVTDYPHINRVTLPASVVIDRGYIIKGVKANLTRDNCQPLFEVARFRKKPIEIEFSRERTTEKHAWDYRSSLINQS